VEAIHLGHPDPVHLGEEAFLLQAALREGDHPVPEKVVVRLVPDHPEVGHRHQALGG